MIQERTTPEKLRYIAKWLLEQRHDPTLVGFAITLEGIADELEASQPAIGGRNR